jgi:hypothetical protein
MIIQFLWSDWNFCNTIFCNLLVESGVQSDVTDGMGSILAILQSRMLAFIEIFNKANLCLTSFNELFKENLRFLEMAIL